MDLLSMLQYSPGGMPQGGYNQAGASGDWWSPGGAPQGGTGFPITPAPLPEGSQVSSNWVSPYGQDYGVTPGYQYTPPPLHVVKPPITNSYQVPGTVQGKHVADLYGALGVTQLTPAEMAQLQAMPAPPPWLGTMTNPTAAAEKAVADWVKLLPAPLQAQATRGGTLAKYMANPSFWDGLKGSNFGAVAFVPNPSTQPAWTPQTQRDLAAQYGYAPRSVARTIQNTPGGPTTTRYDYQPVDTANIMQTLKQMGWTPGTGTVNWNQTAGINPGTGQPYTAAQQQMFKDLQASIAPRKGNVNFDPITHLYPWETPRKEGVGDPRNPATAQTPDLDALFNQQWELSQRQAYNDNQMGGNFFGGTIPAQSNAPPGAPWDTLNALGVFKDAEQKAGWTQNPYTGAWSKNPDAAQPYQEPVGSFPQVEQWMSEWNNYLSTHPWQSQASQPFGSLQQQAPATGSPSFQQQQSSQPSPWGGNNPWGGLNSSPWG